MDFDGTWCPQAEPKRSDRTSPADLPQVQSRQKQLDSEIQVTNKKINNLVQRVSELPTDLPADLFFEQIKQLNLKIQEMKQVKENLAKQTHELMKHELDEKGLVERIRRTIERLDTAPPTQRVGSSTVGIGALGRT